MYELLFRSRWYALVWALFMSASAIMFTTTGAGAWFAGTNGDAQASRDMHESQFSRWAEDERRRTGDDQGYDPSSPERVRDGIPGRGDVPDPAFRTAPFGADEADGESAGSPVSQ